MKDLDSLHYFWDIEVARSTKDIVISQRKFILDMFEEYGLLGAKPYSILMEANLKMGYTNENVLPNPTLYRQMLGKLMYITLTDQALHIVYMYYLSS